MQKLNNRLKDIQSFMFINKLKLNPDKTKFILIVLQKIVKNSSLTSILIFWEIRSRPHKVSGTSEWCSTRPLLDLNTSVLFANALVSSRLDYWNSLSLSLPDFELRRLQLVQNSLCRVVTHSSRCSHISPQPKKLHWLPVRYRVQFKIGLIA